MRKIASVTAVILLALASAGVATGQSVMAPAPRTSDGIRFLTGGVGIGEREAMQRQAAEYSLRLTFVIEPRGRYLGAVNVKIADGDGRTLLKAQSDGPWLFAQLPAGKYSVAAEYSGQAQSQSIEITKTRPGIVLFRFQPAEQKQ